MNAQLVQKLCVYHSQTPGPMQIASTCERGYKTVLQHIEQNTLYTTQGGGGGGGGGGVVT